jgi:hypothetical protein
MYLNDILMPDDCLRLTSGSLPPRDSQDLFVIDFISIIHYPKVFLEDERGEFNCFRDRHVLEPILPPEYRRTGVYNDCDPIFSQLYIFTHDCLVISDFLSQECCVHPD